MKKILLASFATLMIASIPNTAKAVDNPGCGLGSMLFEGRKGVLTDVLAATTNGTFGNQTFGMSSGTSGCKKNAPIHHREFTLLVRNNYEGLAMAIAKADANDEIVISAANILEVTPEHLVKVTHDNFDTIFTGDAEYTEVSMRISELI